MFTSIEDRYALDRKLFHNFSGGCSSNGCVSLTPPNNLASACSPGINSRLFHVWRPLFSRWVPPLLSFLLGAADMKDGAGLRAGWTRGFDWLRCLVGLQGGFQETMTSTVDKDGLRVVSHEDWIHVTYEDWIQVLWGLNSDFIWGLNSRQIRTEIMSYMGTGFISYMRTEVMSYKDWI